MKRPFRFAPPTPGRAAVLRPRLLSVVGRRFDLRLVTIEAGAGLGKTTLLAHAVIENELAGSGRDCWVTCEPADSSASTLLGALLEAVGAPDTDDQPQVESVCAAVWASTPEQVCIVLDDVHHIEVGSTGENVVQRLLAELPENGHLVLAGRRLPEVPRTRLIVHERAAEITADDLRLDGAETSAFATSHGVAVEVVQEAGGWPALAELYARTGRTHAELFVWEEVLANLPDRERDAFLLVVGLGGADATALEVVVGGPCDERLLAELPLVSTDGHGGIRPHALWRELLRGRLDPALAAAARRRLATALLEEGDHGPAFELLADTSDWEHALPTLFEACNDQRRPPWRDQMERWRERIPADITSEPEVVYLEAMIERAGDAWSTGADDLFARAIEQFRVRGDVVQEVTARVRALYPAWLRGDRELFDSSYERAVEVIAAGVPIQAIAVTNRACLADIDGRSADVRALTAQMTPLEPRLRHFKGLLSAFAALAEGEPEKAVADAADAAAAAAAVAPAAGTGWAWLAPTVVAWARGDLAGALARPVHDPGSRYLLAERVPAVAMAAVMAAHLGAGERASALVHDIDELVPDLGPRDLLAGFQAVAAAAAAVAAGDEHGARVALREGLADRPLDPAGAGRALRWFPSLPYLFHERSRELLDSLPSGPSRGGAIDVCRALLAARDGTAKVPAALLEDAAGLLTVLPAPLATELVVRAGRGGPASVQAGCVSAMADVAPSAVRESLRGLAASAEREVAKAAQALLATVPIPPTVRVRIEVLGPARLLRDGTLVEDAGWRRQRVRQMVCAFVALRSIRRTRLGTMLWPEFDEKAVSSNLRITLSYLQALLEPQRGRGDAPWFLQQGAGVLRLTADECLSVDAWEFEAALDASDAAADAGTPSLELQHLLTATSLWQGDYLEEVAGEEWAEPLRERARQRFVRAAVRAGDLLLASGRCAEALELAERALDTDPWSEPALRLHVSAHLAAGDRSSALHAFEAGRRTLMDLGVAPEAATEELGRRLQA